MGLMERGGVRGWLQVWTCILVCEATFELRIGLRAVLTVLFEQGLGDHEYEELVEWVELGGGRDKGCRLE